MLRATDLNQAIVAFVEIGRVLHVRGCSQLTVQPVGPTVERAGDHLAVPLPLQQFRAAMTAAVAIGPQGPLPIAQHDQGRAANFQGGKVTGSFPTVATSDPRPNPRQRARVVLQQGPRRRCSRPTAASPSARLAGERRPVAGAILPTAFLGDLGAPSQSASPEIRLGSHLQAFATPVKPGRASRVCLAHWLTHVPNHLSERFSAPDEL